MNHHSTKPGIKSIIKGKCVILTVAAGALLLGGCRSQKGMVAHESGCHSTISGKETSSRPWLSGDDYRSQLVAEAETWLGTPYKYAEAEKGVGSDCSGMIMRIYECVLNYKIPRNSALQAEFCVPVTSEEATGGDLVFFATGTDPEKVTHVGILAGDGDSFIHVSSSKGAVVSKLSSNYYASRLLMFGRVPYKTATASHP